MPHVESTLNDKHSTYNADGMCFDHCHEQRETVGGLLLGFLRLLGLVAIVLWEKVRGVK